MAPLPSLAEASLTVASSSANSTTRGAPATVVLSLYGLSGVAVGRGRGVVGCSGPAQAGPSVCTVSLTSSSLRNQSGWARDDRTLLATAVPVARGRVLSRKTQIPLPPQSLHLCPVEPYIGAGCRVSECRIGTMRSLRPAAASPLSLSRQSARQVGSKEHGTPCAEYDCSRIWNPMKGGVEKHRVLSV